MEHLFSKNDNAFIQNLALINTLMKIITYENKHIVLKIFIKNSSYYDKLRFCIFHLKFHEIINEIVYKINLGSKFLSRDQIMKIDIMHKVDYLGKENVNKVLNNYIYKYNLNILEKTEQEAKEKAEQEAKEKAEQEAKEKTEQEAKEKTEQEAKKKTRKYYSRMKALKFLKTIAIEKESSSKRKRTYDETSQQESSSKRKKTYNETLQQESSSKRKRTYDCKKYTCKYWLLNSCNKHKCGYLHYANDDGTPINWVYDKYEDHYETPIFDGRFYCRYVNTDRWYYRKLL